MIRLFEVRVELSYTEKDLKKKCEKLLGCRISQLTLIKRAIDARRKNDIFYSCTVDCIPSGKINPDKKLKYKKTEPSAYSFPHFSPSGRLIIAGSGPAGLFAALELARCGFCPTVLERGGDVDSRTKAIEIFWGTGTLDESTNVQFGEGGAGTFSDGKLNTGINDERIRHVLYEFVKHGAPEEIIYDAAPHIGTDILRNVVKSMREEIISLGGEVLFNTRLDKIITENGRIKGVIAVSKDGEKTIDCDALILAIGHSSRDTARMLYKNGLEMEQKPFSIGVRIEHKQELINQSMYGEFRNQLPPAPYKLWTHLSDGSSLYTFCMCPGGHVVNAASEKERVVTNGMSNYAREGENANSALLVNVPPLNNGEVFAGMELQEKLESLAYKIGGGYKLPVQTLGDFLANTRSVSVGSVEPTIKPGYTLCNLREFMPEFFCNTLSEGITQLDRRIKGFANHDAILTGPETRSSSPIKVIRDKDTLSTSIEGIYSAGEGGGHAGGITSAAVDGIRNAEAAAKYLSDLQKNTN